MDRDTIYDRACRLFLARQYGKAPEAIHVIAIRNFQRHNDNGWGLLAGLEALGVTEEMARSPAGSLVAVPTAPYMTDAQAEAMCAQVGMCGGLALSVYEAAVAARPTEKLVDEASST